MKLPNVRETIFSLKSYLSAIMALYLRTASACRARSGP